MKKNKIRFTEYLHMPEMRLFWLLLGLLIFSIVLALIYFPGAWRIAGVTIFTIAGVIIFMGSQRAARANYEAQRGRKLLDTVISHLSDAVVAHDTDLTILVFNHAAERLFGVSASEVLGTQFSPERATKDRRMQLLGQVMFPSLAPVIIKKTKPGAYPQIVEIVLENPFREFQITSSQMLNEQGEVFGLMRVIHDRTREINLLKSKNEFITVASHQLRTPLTAVSWTFQELQKAGLSLPEMQEMITTGAVAATKLSKIINDFLDIAKLEEGRFGYSFEQINLTDFVSQIVKEAVPVAKQYKVNVYFEPIEKSLPVYLDKSKMGIVFSNLIDNAIKYNVENGNVTVRIRKAAKGPFVEVLISDTGVGISPDEMKKLFSKFFRTKMGMQKDATGSGLGLYLVRNIIHQHGGSINAESIEGRGTTFTFTLPTEMSVVPQAEVPAQEE